MATAQANRTHCPQGHPYDEVNTAVFSDGSRRCRACRAERGRKRNATSRRNYSFPENLLRRLSFQPDGCIVWTGGLDAYGYGNVRKDGQTVKAHRASYELVRGPIPDGLEPDHLCRNRACVNPAHLEPVTHAENCRRSPTIGRQSRTRVHGGS